MFQNFFYPPDLKIAIAGRRKDTENYEKALQEMRVSFTVTMDSGCLSDFHGLLLPGGGDITPAFFGQKNHGSKNTGNKPCKLSHCKKYRIDTFGNRPWRAC